MSETRTAVSRTKGWLRILCFVLLGTTAYLLNFFWDERTASRLSPSPVVLQKEILPAVTCQRTCRHGRNRNKIVYSHIDDAGLGDRGMVLRELSNLAGYLCATIHVAPPLALLTEKHNNHKKVSNKMRWMDFFNWTWIPDGVPVFSEASLALRPARKEWFGQFSHSSSSWLNLQTLDNDDFYEHFLKAEELVAQQLQEEEQEPAEGGFVWELTDNWYHTPWNKLAWTNLNRTENATSMLPGTRRVPGCPYVHEMDPWPMAQFVEGIWEAHIPSNHLVGFFHMRRGDLTNKCDTTVPAVEQFLNCSFYNTTGAARGKNITLLLASDEVDPMYRQELFEVFDRLPSLDLVQQVLDLDQTVSQALEVAFQQKTLPKRLDNNYYVFSVESSMRALSAFSVAREHKNCPVCTPLHDILLNLP